MRESSAVDINIQAESGTWRAGFEERLRASYRAAGLSEAAVEVRLGQILEDVGDWTMAGITADGAGAGYVVVTVADDNGTPAGRIGDLWVDPAYGGRGCEEHARGWAERWCAERGASRVDVRLVGAATRGGGPFAGFPVRGQTRMRALAPGDGPAPLPDGVTARPLTPDEYPRWLAGEEDAYVADIVRAGALTPEEARLKSDRDFARLLPEGLATPDHSFLVLEAAGAPIGTGWLRHGFLPGVTFGYSLEVHERHRGRGFGRAAMAVGERATLAAGDAALMFNVFGGNDVAMSLYTSAGYQVVEENRSIPLA